MGGDRGGADGGSGGGGGAARRRGEDAAPRRGRGRGGTRCRSLIRCPRAQLGTRAQGQRYSFLSLPPPSSRSLPPTFTRCVSTRGRHSQSQSLPGAWWAFIAYKFAQNHSRVML